MNDRCRGHWTARSAVIVAPRARSDLAVETLDSEALLLDARLGDTHRLNETALFVWQRCDGETATREIARQLTACYDVDMETALGCVDQLIVRFAALRLFETPPDPA
jgi:hypothetical protein